MAAPLVSVVTGASRGIGEELCRRLSHRGDRVLGLARTTPADPVSGVEYLACDVTDQEQVASTFARIGPVDVLVNNAGISSSNPIGRTSLEEWNDTMAVNATAVFLCSRAVLGSMIEREAGSIVTVASTTSLEGAPYISAYAASKHAALGFMRVLSAEVTDKGVVATTVCPTYVRTPMTVDSIKNIAERTNCSLVEAEQKLAVLTPHGRILEVEEVAESVMGLIAQGTNGEVVVLDGRPGA